ncbi:MAG: chorismate-binding protein [Burkholderiaceae bacterium]
MRETTDACFALLDDCGADDDPRSRLYTGHAGTLACDPSQGAAGWPAFWDALQASLADGLHAVALLSYETGERLHGIAPREGDAARPSQILLFRRMARLSAAETEIWLAEHAGDGAEGAAGVAGIAPNIDDAGFDQAVERIRGYIAAGDAYQVNFTYRLRFTAFGAPAALYRALRARQPAPYGALIALPDGGAVLSLSPELFVRCRDGALTAQPMKGTAPAAGEPGPDAARADALAADPKNRAENLMIVDLLRNDLGRIAATGSVAVPALFDVARHGAVLQMTSTVTAQLRDGVGLGELLAALYPCGSITGAPKRRAMQIVRELEAAPRGWYTGAIGWFDAPSAGWAAERAVGDFCLSVPIRTLVLDAPHAGGELPQRRGELGVGAGIVHDSVAADERAECRWKAAFLTGLRPGFEGFDLFETMHAQRGAGVRHLDRHLRRLADSARRFGLAFDEGATRDPLMRACAAFADDAPRRLRLTLDANGRIAATAAPLTPLTVPVRVGIAPDATDPDDLFLRHKTGVRARYDAAWRAAEAAGRFDLLFFNARGELTEGGRCNVFVRRGGHWFTPPLSCGLLPGVMRAALLDDPAWSARERVLTREDLREAEEVVVCNALRGALPAVVDWTAGEARQETGRS